jgi:hypothetical protein
MDREKWVAGIGDKEQRKGGTDHASGLKDQIPEKVSNPWGVLSRDFAARSFQRLSTDN